MHKSLKRGVRANAKSNANNCFKTSFKCLKFNPATQQNTIPKNVSLKIWTSPSTQRDQKIFRRHGFTYNGLRRLQRMSIKSLADCAKRSQVIIDIIITTIIVISLPLSPPSYPWPQIIMQQIWTPWSTRQIRTTTNPNVTKTARVEKPGRTAVTTTSRPRLEVSAEGDLKCHLYCLEKVT